MRGSELPLIWGYTLIIYLSIRQASSLLLKSYPRLSLYQKYYFCRALILCANLVKSGVVQGLALSKLSLEELNFSL